MGLTVWAVMHKPLCGEGVEVGWWLGSTPPSLVVVPKALTSMAMAGSLAFAAGRGCLPWLQLHIACQPSQAWPPHSGLSV